MLTTPSAEPAPPPVGSARRGDNADAAALLARFREVRGLSERLCKPLEVEDYVIQTMEDVSPAKWHLGHTTWFYERFILQEVVEGYRPVSEPYYYLFNSYYNAAGPMHCRPSRGLLSRPTVAEVYGYRREIDRRMAGLLAPQNRRERAPRASGGGGSSDMLRDRLILGLNHEQQHQELMVTDLKHIFSSNPLLPAYHRPEHAPPTPGTLAPQVAPPPAAWVPFEEGLRDMGRDLDGAGFCYDNETPRHRVYLRAFALASRPVSNAEYVRFVEDGGYERHELWLSAGWATVQKEGWRQPIYWFRDEPDPARPATPPGDLSDPAATRERAGASGPRWMQYTLSGPMPVDPAEPVCHLSYFEADAFARWAGGRLPTESEWEAAAAESGVAVAGNFVDAGLLHPEPMRAGGVGDSREALEGMFGDVWEWTASQYTPYPGFRALPGALGEYNGKFMCNQFVLRGGSCATSQNHTRVTYRNFFPPHARWQFTGLRLAKDL